MEIILDFKAIKSKEELHCYLQQQLHLPENYGNNLDALHDCLSERRDKYCVRVEHLDHLRSILGDYADTLVQVFKDSGNSVIGGEPPMPKKKHTSAPSIMLLFIALFIITALIITPLSFQPAHTKASTIQTEQEKVIIRDAQKIYRENITVELHKTNKSCYAIVTPDTVTNKAVTFTSQNPAIMTVSTVNSNGTYYAHITGIAEGVTTITATTASGKTYSSYVTVYTATEDVTGTINTATPLKKTALPQADTFTKTASINDIGTVKGRVGNYLCLDMPAGYLEKNYHIAYIEKEKVTIPCTAIQLDAAALTLHVNEKRMLRRKVMPLVASNRKVRFTSSNPGTATVSNKGTIKARKRGTAVITCTAADGSGITATCTVTVRQQVKKLLVRKANYTLHKGDSKKLTAKITPQTADNKTVTWSSSNETIATVDSQGKVTAKSPGTATITCTAQDGSGVTGTSRITVEPKYKLKIEDIGTLTAGDTVTAKAKLFTEDGTLVKQSVKSGNRASSPFIWSSSNKSIATADKTTGMIYAIHPGRFVLICKTKDGKTVARKTIRIGDPGKVTNKVFKNIPKEKFFLYEKNKSVLLSPNTEGLTWNSSNPAIATVKNGMVTMKSSGSVLIQCTKDNKKTKACRLHLYQKVSKPYGIQQADPKTGSPRRKVTILGTLGKTGLVTVAGKKKAAVAAEQVLLYSDKANRDYFFKNRNTLFKGIHFLNQDTLEYNEKEAIVYNIVDDTLYIHINVKFRGDAVQDMFTTQGLYGKIENKGRYQKLVTEAIESSYSIDKVDFTMTPLPNNLKLKVVSKINDVTPKQYIRAANSSPSPQHTNNNYIIIQIGSYQEQPGKITKPTLDNGSYWYFTKQSYKDIAVKKTSRSLYHYSHYRRKSNVKENRKVIYLPTKEMLKQNVGKYYEVPSAVIYKRSVAHEMGHVLGLDDAYGYEGETTNISRVCERLQKQELIMREGKLYDKISSLELVMLLYARNQSNEQSSISLQSFHNYSIYTHKDVKGTEHYEAGKLSEAVK